jgi:uncharacterized iron-regulated membrane protein
MKPLKRPDLRVIWVQIHLWLGLTLGVVGALVGLSGSILVYDHELDHALNPQRYAISGPEIALGFTDYAQRARQALDDGARPTGIRLPDLEDGPVMVFARSGSGPFQRVYLDPPTGRVLDTASGRDYLGWLHSFHESLTLREYNGREIVGVVGIAMLISSLSGIYLWWPARGTLRHSLGFRRGFALTRNLHYTCGFWGALLLALLSFTGIFLAFPDAGRKAVAVFGPVSPSPRGIQAPESSGQSIGPDDAVAIARALYPDAAVVGLGFPAGRRGAYRVNLREPGDTTPRSGTVAFIDPRSRAILHRADRAGRTAGDGFLVWQRILHEGGAFGGAGRFVTFLGGLLPGLLMATGLTMWLRNRRRSGNAGFRARDVSRGGLGAVLPKRRRARSRRGVES